MLSGAIWRWETPQRRFPSGAVPDEPNLSAMSSSLQAAVAGNPADLTRRHVHRDLLVLISGDSAEVVAVIFGHREAFQDFTHRGILFSSRRQIGEELIHRLRIRKDDG